MTRGRRCRRPSRRQRCRRDIATVASTAPAQRSAIADGSPTFRHPLLTEEWGRTGGRGHSSVTFFFMRWPFWTWESAAEPAAIAGAASTATAASGVVDAPVDEHDHPQVRVQRLARQQFGVCHNVRISAAAFCCPQVPSSAAPSTSSAPGANSARPSKQRRMAADHTICIDTWLRYNTAATRFKVRSAAPCASSPRASSHARRARATVAALACGYGSRHRMGGRQSARSAPPDSGEVDFSSSEEVDFDDARSEVSSTGSSEAEADASRFAESCAQIKDRFTNFCYL